MCLKNKSRNNTANKQIKTFRKFLSVLMIFGTVKTAPKTTPKRKIEPKKFLQKWSNHPL